MNAGTGQWWLAAQVAPSRPDTKVEVAIHRKLNAEEVGQAREANAFVQRLASVAPYALLVRLYRELEQAMERDLSAQRRASDMNRSACALGKAAGDLPDNLRRDAQDDFDPGGDAFHELEQAIVEETQRAEFQFLVAVGQLEQGLFTAVENAVALDPDAGDIFGSVAAEVESMAGVMGLLRAGVVVAQRLISRQLLIYQERIEEVSLFLRRLAAEIPDGEPTLFWSDSVDPERGETTRGQTSFDPLALDKARYLHRALRQARTLLQSTSSSAGQPGETSDRARIQESENDIDHGQNGTMATVRAAAGGQSPAATEGIRLPAGEREDQVVDLRALAKHVTAFVDSLEKAWSVALDNTLLAEAQREMDARYASLLSAITRRAAAADDALTAAGIDPGLPAQPLQPDELARLSFDPEPEQRWRQRQLAEIDALMTLLEALKAIRAPSAHLVYLDQQRVESWWEAGAFALIRDRAALLVRVSEQVASAEAELTGTSRASTAPSAFVDKLNLAGSALGHGDIEAALIHTRCALRLRAALTDDVVPDDLLERLAHDTRLAEGATVLRLLDQAARKLVANEDLDIGLAMLLAPRALAVVRRLCLETPQIIIAALETRGGHAGG
jgi:hypothetical protein